MDIRNMKKEDLSFVTEWAIEEGWTTENNEAFEGFLLYDPEGCFIAHEGGKYVGVCIATYYGEFGFIGELIVTKEMRGRGFGEKLLAHAVQYLQDRGSRYILLDAVLRAVTLYERAGFRKFCRSMRFGGIIDGESSSHVREMRIEDLKMISKMDYEVFGADRGFYLKRRFSLYPQLCKVMEVEGRIYGYIMGHQSGRGVSIGPWIVFDNTVNPVTILKALACETRDHLFQIGVLETNTEAIEKLRSLELIEKPDPPWRMVLGQSGLLGSSEKIYAMGSAAKG
jgi:ribosomal protein S18 acetylase RimI-like enzyme